MVNHPNRGATQKPSVGRIVIFRQSDHDAMQTTNRAYIDHFPNSRDHTGTNCTRDHAAIITRVWSDTCVNLHVFFDAHDPESRNSVVELAELPEGTTDTSGNGGWFWPPRT